MLFKGRIICFSLVNLYLVESPVHFATIYWLDSDLSLGEHYPSFMRPDNHCINIFWEHFCQKSGSTPSPEPQSLCWSSAHDILPWSSLVGCHFISSKPSPHLPLHWFWFLDNSPEPIYLVLGRKCHFYN